MIGGVSMALIAFLGRNIKIGLVHFCQFKEVVRFDTLRYVKFKIIK